MNDPSLMELGQSYFDLHHKMHRIMEKAMCEAGLSVARAKVLSRIESCGPMNQAALAGKLGFAPRSVTETVDALEREGLVTRSEDPKDRRARIIALTDAGREAYDVASGVREKALTEIFGSLTPAQRQTFGGLLDTIRTTLTTDHTESPCS